MSVFENTLPDVPASVGSDYVIFRSNILKEYWLFTGHFTCDGFKLVPSNSTSYSSQWKYNSDIGEWQYISTSNPGSLNVLISGRTILYSSHDIFYKSSSEYADGTLYFSSGYSSSSPLMNESLSSSLIYDSLKKSVLPVVSLVIVAIVCFFGFRKAWSFITEHLRGA